MMDLSLGPLWVITAASAPSLASGVWVVWRWWFDRTDRLADTASSREALVLRDLEAQRVALSRDQAELFDRLRTELARIQLRLLEVERDRDRGWDLARWWNRRSHELRHAGINAQAIVVGFCARDNIDPPKWPDMELSALEDPG